ncbi:hypothetical protein [Spirillospora albida]|uniref:hypothetical protein n=1 Tax=Spirillospora albida TaxID=58123 RepID=UPI0004C1654A|nr:hypothetical protein [Spirillospora albida]
MAGPYARSRWLLPLAVAIVLAACGGNSSASDPPPSPPAGSPSGPSARDAPAEEDLVLRWQRTGGIAGLGGPGALPDFSLYSSGRALAVSRDGLTEYRLRPAALDRLLADARRAGLGRSRSVGSEEYADAFTVTISMGKARTTIIDPAPPSDPAVRFHKRLFPEAWPAADQSVPPSPYRPARTAVLAGESTGSGTPRPWPLKPLGEGVQAAGGICTLARTSDLPREAGKSLWRSEGRIYSVRLRPLLPDEESCRDLT